MSGAEWVDSPKTYKTFHLNDEGRGMIRAFFNQRRAMVFHDPQKQNRFLRHIDGAISHANSTRRNLNRTAPDQPKLKPGQRFDAHEINMAKLIASSIALPFEWIFETPASGKENSVFFQLVNHILYQIELNTEDGQKVQLGKEALKTMHSGKARKKV